jgi:hypothetical protein
VAEKEGRSEKEGEERNRRANLVIGWLMLLWGDLAFFSSSFSAGRRANQDQVGRRPLIELLLNKRVN